MRARNAVQYGPYSETVVILAAQIPDTVPLPTVVFVPDVITITWTAVYIRGSPLLGYKILFLANDGSYKEEKTHCDGSSPAIMSALTCTIPTNVFTQSPLSLPWGSTVQTKVLAYNTYGDSLDSAISTAVFIRKKPDAPILTENRALRTPTSFGLQWEEPFTGGAPIIDYRITYD